MRTETWDEVSRLYEKDPRLALTGFHIGGGLNMEEDSPNEFLRHYEASSVCHMTKSYAFAYRKGTPYVRPFSKIIRRFQSAGLVTKLINDVLNNQAPLLPYIYELLEFEKSHVTEYKNFQLKNVVGIFKIFIGGLVVAIIVFICEIIVASYKNVGSP